MAVDETAVMVVKSPLASASGSESAVLPVAMTCVGASDGGRCVLIPGTGGKYWPYDEL